MIKISNNSFHARRRETTQIIANILLQRMQECRDIYDDVLEKPFDFDANENINVDYEKLPYAKNKRELVDRWRKQLKLQALSSITDKQKLEEDKKEKDAKYVVKSFIF